MDHRALLLSLRDLLASAQTLVQHMLTLEGGSDALVTPPPKVPPALPGPQPALPAGPSRAEGAPPPAPTRDAAGAGPASDAKPPRDRTAQKRALPVLLGQPHPRGPRRPHRAHAGRPQEEA